MNRLLFAICLMSILSGCAANTTPQSDKEVIATTVRDIVFMSTW